MIKLYEQTNASANERPNTAPNAHINKLNKTDINNLSIYKAIEEHAEEQKELIDEIFKNSDVRLFCESNEQFGNSIKQAIINLVKLKVKNIETLSLNNIDYALQDYLKAKNEKTIKNHFAYFQKCLENSLTSTELQKQFYFEE